MADKTHSDPASVRLTSDSGSGSKRPSGQKLTRNRIPLSCQACRSRKLKCNREQPCQNCVARGKENAASCSYAEKERAEKRRRGGRGSIPRADGEDMRKRLNHLEGSILSMLDHDEIDKTARTGSGSLASTSRTCDCVSGGQKISVDTRSTNWDTVLKEIGQMKDACNDEHDTIEYSGTPCTKFRPNLLNGLVQPLDRSTLLESLPEKRKCDILVDRFFEAHNPFLPIRVLLHRATFLKQYHQHWLTPNKTQIIWIGLLYSVLCYSMQSYSPNDENPAEYIDDSGETTNLYRLRTAQCIATADIMKPTEFTIEALMLYSYMEFRNEGDGHMGPFILSGIIIKIALQQGYHRDPSEQPNLTVFQGEMRRRVWCSITQYELITAGMMGLPKCWKYVDCDTLLPSNLHEEELWEDMKVLPPSRPLSEQTQITYHVIKAELLRGFGRVLEFLHTLAPQPYDEVMRIDLSLIKTRERIPDFLRFGTFEEMRDNPPALIVEKYILEHFYHKAICVLHRKFWVGAPYSQKTCITSALTLLRHQATLHQAHRPGEPLYEHAWYQTVVLLHDFLLAAMILALDIVNMRSIGHSDVQYHAASEGDKIKALTGSRAIWASIKTECSDASRAVKVLDKVLGRVYTQRQKPILTARDEELPITSLSYSVASNNTSEVPVPQDELEHETVGLGSLGGEDDDMCDSFWGAIGSPNLELPADFDWDTWDQLITPQQTQFQPASESEFQSNGASN